MKRAYPRVWLFTDERQCEKLWTALARLPRGAGVVFRHYGVAGRRAFGARVRAVARRRGLAFLVAGTARQARSMRADGQHRPRWAPGGCARGGRARGLFTATAHGVAELRAAERAGAGLVFLSPVFATTSHPGMRPLGRVRLGLLARHARGPVAALGAVDATRYRSLRTLGVSAWGGIDAHG